MRHGLNLSRRPFVDTRPMNALVGGLLALVVFLSAVSFHTIARYLSDSKRTRTAIAQLRGEIGRLEGARRAAEASLARFDVQELSTSAADANQIARRRAFSWTRFLTRLEEVLPANLRVVSISLAQSEGSKEAAMKSLLAGTAEVDLLLISRDPEGLPKAIRAFYASPHFDRPTPLSEETPERGVAEGRRMRMSVLYRDAGDKTRGRR